MHKYTRKRCVIVLLTRIFKYNYMELFIRSESHLPRRSKCGVDGRSTPAHISAIFSPRPQPPAIALRFLDVPTLAVRISNDRTAVFVETYFLCRFFIYFFVIYNTSSTRDFVAWGYSTVGTIWLLKSYFIYLS